MTEQIKELEKALERSLMHENECAFVHTSTIKICLDFLKTWEEVLEELGELAKEYSNKMEDTKDESDKDFFNGQSLAYFDAYAFIKQKLLENDNG